MSQEFFRAARRADFLEGKVGVFDETLTERTEGHLNNSAIKDNLGGNFEGRNVVLQTVLEEDIPSSLVIGIKSQVVDEAELGTDFELIGAIIDQVIDNFLN